MNRCEAFICHKTIYQLFKRSYDLSPCGFKPEKKSKGGFYSFFFVFPEHFFSIEELTVYEIVSPAALWALWYQEFLTSLFFS